MIDGGYILQPRKFDESEASKLSPITRELWFYILRNVNHKDGKQFERGQNFFNFGEIQEALSWYIGYRKMVYSKPQITKAIRRLNERNMTATAKATRGLIITVLNYSYYQDPKNYEGNGEGSTKVSRRKSKGHTINKNDKNERMKEDKKSKPKKVFTPPTEEEVIKYFYSKGYSLESAQKAFSYYDANDWKDSRGNKVKSWKQKMIGVWFKDENKITSKNNNKPKYETVGEHNTRVCKELIDEYENRL